MYTTPTQPLEYPVIGELERLKTNCLLSIVYCLSLRCIVHCL